MDKKPTITIIGSGVSGLCAAITLQKAGYNCTVFEASKTIGGRTQTQTENKLILDHGFQVMLDAYPAVHKFLNIEKLQVKPFLPGSIVHINGKEHTIGDPLRYWGFLVPTLIAGVASLKDKLLVFKLSKALKSKSIDAIFTTKETTTLDYLKEYGFSQKIITQFFKPFYTGIFLETELETSSRMFEFVFKMFAEGSAVLPTKGIQEIPNQLAALLKPETIKTSKKVEKIESDTVILQDGEIVKSDYIICTVDPATLISNMAGNEQEWHQVTNIYFETDHSGLDKPIIQLLAGDNLLCNNFYFLQDILPDHKNVVSASVIRKHHLNDHKLVEQVTKELREQANIVVNNSIKIFHIKQALPKLKNIMYSVSPTETQLTDHVFLAGDLMANGSLNSAMLNGEAAALAIISKIEDNPLVALV